VKGKSLPRQAEKLRHYHQGADLQLSRWTVHCRRTSQAMMVWFFC
jgi:hypothetical protein